MHTKDLGLCSQRRICFKFTVDASVSDTGKLCCTSDLVFYGGNKTLIIMLCLKCYWFTVSEVSDLQT